MKQQIIDLLPYSKPFHFVDELISVGDDEISGSYTFKKEEYFYQGHFKGNPVTPGVILTECMAQIGLVCMGLYFLIKDKSVALETNDLQVAFIESKVQFLGMVLPGEKVTVTSKKKFWRMGKLKCEVEMHNEDRKLVVKGELAGMIKVKS